MTAGWTRKRLCELTTKIGSGATPVGGQEAYKAEGIALIRSLNVHDLEFRFDDLARIDEAQAQQLSNVVVQPNDVLLNITGASVARCCMVPNLVLPARVNQHVSIIRPVPEYLDSTFLAYMLVSPAAKSALLGAGEASGATRQALTKGFLQEFEISFPPLNEQRRIVAVLDEALGGLADARENAAENLESVERLTQSILGTLFSRQDASWKSMTLPDAALVFGRGKSRHRPRNDPKLYGGEYPFFQTGDVRGSRGRLREYSQTYNEAGLAQSKLWPAGTVCITIAANIAETAVLGIDGCFPDSIIGMIPDPGTTSPEYVELMLRTFSTQLKEAGKGSAQDNINLGTFETRTFPFPPPDVQARIVDAMATIEVSAAQLTAIYEEQLVGIEKLRQSLLQKAFSGELI